VSRARRLYFLCLALAIALLLASVWISQDRFDAVPSVGLPRLVVIAATLGATAATWGTAVMIASVHRIVWPLVTTVVAVVMGLGGLAAFWHFTGASGW
jgi:drug/metabolite transporter (DMT)-like permease